MNRKLNSIYVLLTLALVFSTIAASASTSQVIPEWKVQVGDTHTLTVTKFTDIGDTDRDGDTDTSTMLVQDKDGNMVNLTTKKGTKTKIEIMALNNVTGQVTIQVTQGGVTQKEAIDPGYWVTKTVDNKTYWEDMAEIMTSDFMNVSVEGSNFVFSTKITVFGMTVESVQKRNWKTGWMTYLLAKTSNTTHTISEMELSTGSIAPGFEIIPIFAGFFFLAIFISKNRKKR